MTEIPDIIKCIDSDEKLNIWSYSECDNHSDISIKNCRGLIKDKQGNMVCGSFGYTDEYTLNDIPESLDTNEWDWFYSYEATMLRLYYYDDQWYISTHKKINAFKSRWSCKQTFGELFVDYMNEIFGKGSELIDYLTSEMDTNRKYFFLLKSNPQNRIVCHSHYHYKKSRIVLLGWSDNDSVFSFHSQTTGNEVLDQIPCPQSVPIHDNEHLQNLVNNINIFEYPGVIGFHKETKKTIKILHPDYKKLYNIRGNNPNLRFRYLEIRNDPEKVQLLYYLYPKLCEVFDEYENTLFKISRLIYRYYIQRYIKKMYITLPKEEYNLMKKCHQWYLSDRQNNRIFSQKILEFMGEESALNLYKMIRRYHLNPNMVYDQNMRMTDSFLTQKNYSAVPPQKSFTYYNKTKLSDIQFSPLEFPSIHQVNNHYV